MPLSSAVKGLVFAMLYGFRPRCGCGAFANRVQSIEVKGHKVGIMLTCDEHVASGNIKYTER